MAKKIWVGLANFFGWVGWGGGHQSPLCNSYISCYCSLALHTRYLWCTEADRAWCETRMTFYCEHELFATVARSQQQMPENNQQLSVSIRVSMYDVINLPVDWRILWFLVSRTSESEEWRRIVSLPRVELVNIYKIINKVTACKIIIYLYINISTIQESIPVGCVPTAP